MASDRPRRTRAPPAHLAAPSSDDESPAPSPVSSRPSRVRSRSVSLGFDATSSGGETAGPSSAGPSRKRARASTGTAAMPAAQDDITTSESYIFYADLVDRLIARPESAGFRLPVGDLWEDSAIPDYYEIITKPMDLGTVKRNLKEKRTYIRNGREGAYLDEDAVLADIRLVFNNCLEYNAPESEFYELATQLLEFVDDFVGPRIRRREETMVERRRQRDRDRRARQKAEKEARLEEEARVKAEEEERRKERKRLSDAKRRAAQKAEKERKAEADRDRRMKKVAERKAEKERREEAATARSSAEVDSERERQLAHNRNRVREYRRKQRELRNRSSSVSVSADEQEVEEVDDAEEEEEIREVKYNFVSTRGLEKKRGRKSVAVMNLEAEHEALMTQRRELVEARIALNARKLVQLTHKEKLDICDAVQVLDFVRMKTVVEIIAKGMNRDDLLNEVMVDIDIDRIDNEVLREIQFYLDNPALALAQETIHQIEMKLADIESKLVSMRYSKPTGPSDRRRSAI